VRSDADTTAALHTLANDDAQYRLFNLLLHDGDTLAFATNHVDARSADRIAMRTLDPGIHGISNGAISNDDRGPPWPKTQRLMTRLDDWRIASAADRPSDTSADLEPLFEALADITIAPDAHLPDTGIGLERERLLSPAFIAHAAYGTRASTVVLIADDHAQIVERRFGPEAQPLGETRILIAFDT
jgi:uncharacterized protein with NRDE domain